MSDKLAKYVKDKTKDDSLFDLTAASISGKIKTFARKAGVDIHAHSLRDYFATSLSEKGATIREIQALLGHANLTHTERYTLHTDRHLKHAIELIDQEPAKKPIATAPGKTDDQLKITQQPSYLESVVTLRSFDKPSSVDHTKVLASDYFSHFVACNEGPGPAIEIELALFGSDKRSLLEGYRETVLRVSEELEFQPMLNRPKGKYYLFCQYKRVSSESDEDAWNQTWLPFNLSRASKEGEVYVAPGELEFKFRILKKDKIEIFLSKPK